MTGRHEIDTEGLRRQESTFARAYAAGDPGLARDLYASDVVYVSPTVRLYDAPAEIAGVEATLAFIARTLETCRKIRYEAVEQAVLPGGASAFVRIHFDWDAAPERRLRSDYVVLYRYRGGRIARQQLYYDPSGRLETL